MKMFKNIFADFMCLIKSILCRIYVMLGRREIILIYKTYKERQIENTITKDKFEDSILGAGYGIRLDERIVEYPWLFSRLPAARGNLLDAGSALNYKYLLNLDKIRNKSTFIQTLAPEKKSYWRDGVSYVYSDLRNSCFADNFFDWIVSISTLEHVGLDNTVFYTNDSQKNESKLDDYLLVVNEFRRILKTNGKVYITLPFGKHENFKWFQQFDSSMVDKIIKTFNPSSFRESYFKYSANGWQISSRKETANMMFSDNKKSSMSGNDYVIAARSVVCLELEK